MFIKQFNTKTEFDNYIQGNATIGRYFIVSDENNNNKPTEYYWDGINVNFIGGNENYKIVDTIEDRDNISIDNLNDGILVYVINEKIEYKLENGQWTINDIVYNKDVTTEIRTYYVDSINGSDETGDGTELNPWQSLEKCISSIPSILYHRTNIQLLDGEYLITSKANMVLTNFIVHQPLIFQGKLNLVDEDITTVGGTKDLKNPNKKTINKTIEANQYYGYCGVNSTNIRTPIGKHGDNDLVSGLIADNLDITSVEEYRTTLRFELNRSPYITVGSNRVRFDNLIINWNGTNWFATESPIELRFVNCVFEPFTAVSMRFNFKSKTYMHGCLFKSNSTINPYILADKNNFFIMYRTLIYNEANTGTCFNLTDSDIELLNGCYFEGFDEIFRGEGNSSVIIENNLTLNNINRIFGIFNGGFVLNKRGSLQIFINNVTSYFNIVSGLGNISIDIKNNVHNPEDLLGQPFQGTIPPKLVDPSKNFSIQYDGSETFESEYIHYRIVNTIEDRDAIPVNERVEGLVVYVSEDRSEYRLESDLVTWITNDLIYNKTTTIESKTYYVDNTGSDETGDGTELNPLKTIEKCLSTIPSNLVHRTNIQLGEGIYDWTAKCNSLLQNFILNGQLRIYGKTELIRSDFTTVGGVVNPNNAFEKTVVGATWNEDEYFGKLIGGTSLDNLSTCSYHSTNSLSTPRIKEGTNFTHLYDKLSTIILETGVIFNTLVGTTALQFRNLNVNTIASRLELYSGNARLRLMSCEIKLDNKLLQGYGTIEILDSLVTSENTMYAIRIKDTDLFEFRNTQLIDIGGSNGNTAIHIQSKRILFFNSEITNYNTAFLISSTSQVIPSWGDSVTRSILFKNIGTIFNVFSNNFKLDFFNSEIYLNNVNYAVNLNNLSYNNINIDLRGRIASGDFNLGVFEGTPPPKLVDPSKNFSIQYDGSETFESEYIHYRIVNDITERDNILYNEKTEGMLVYTISGDTEYRWIDNEWSINSTNSGLSDSYWSGVTGTDDIYYNDGKVGINKYPDELLDINGNININSGYSYMIDNQIAFRILPNVNNNNLYSVHVGFNTGSDDITESETAIGYYSLKRNVGKFSVGVGTFAGNDNVGNYSTMIGSSAGSANSGITITSIGFESGYNNTGDYLTSIGGHSGSLNIGYYCTFIGAYSGIQNFANNVVAIGYESASGNTMDNQFIIQQRNININPLIQGDFLTGNVGINTPVATATLDINGNIRIRQGAAEGRVLTCDNSGLASWQTISGTTIGTTTLRNLDDVSPDGSNDDGKALVWNSIDNTHYYVNFPEDNGSSGGFLGGVTQSTSQPIELKQNQWVQPLPTNTYDIEYTFDNFKDQSNASIYVNLSTEDVKLRYIEDNGGYWEKVSFIKPLTEGKTWIGNSFNQAEEYDTLLEWVGTESELTGIGQKYSLETQNYYVVAHDTIRIGKNIITKTINLKDVSNIKILNNVSGKSLLTTNILLRIKQDINEQFTFSIGSYSSSYDNIVNTTSISNSNNNQIYPLILPITISQIGLPSNELKITTGDVYFKITQPTTNDMFVDIIYDAVWI